TPPSFSFFLTTTPPTQLYTLSLHDALPISSDPRRRHPYFAAIAPWMIASTSGAEPNRTGSVAGSPVSSAARATASRACATLMSRSEEHTSELQSLRHLVCRLLLEKKKK